MSPDVVVVGAGGDGPVLAWRLAQQGVDVRILEAGPWHGNREYPAPHDRPGGDGTDSPDPLDGDLLDEQYTDHEEEMGSPRSGKLRWGPADRDRPPWVRTVPQNGFVWQTGGVGGTTLVYLGNHPRAFPAAVEPDDHWPIGYEALLPYYRELEQLHPVCPAPTTPKEAVFFEGCRELGFERNTDSNVTRPGYRPMPNAILRPDDRLRGEYDGDYRHPDIEGSTLAGQELHGDPHPRGAPVEKRAKRSTLVSMVPRALRTGNVTIQPNAFVTDVLTARRGGERVATGVEYRDTWSGETDTVEADVVVLAAGAIETPRLWLNAGLPDDGWVGRGLTTHWFDWVVGFFETDTVEELTGRPEIRPHVGQNGAARLDYPGLGALAVNATPPAIGAASTFAISQAGYSFDNDVPADAPWDGRGRVVGRELKELMAQYPQMLSVIVHTDDQPRKRNGIRLDPTTRDEHGPVPVVEWEPSNAANRKRDRLAELAAKLLDEAGATRIHRTDQAPTLLHLQSTMPLGTVTDSAAEARQVKRLFVGDHSVIPNGLGGPNPTHTGQALALRTAEKIHERYL
jgi:choline dehydrogenase-like flavoprotein